MKQFAITFAAILSCALFACGKKEGGGGGGNCTTALENVLKVMEADMKANAPSLDEKLISKLKEVSLQRCNEDKWSAEALKCMSTAKTSADVQTCEALKTQSQRDKLAEATKALFSTMPPDPGSGTGAGTGSTGSAGSADPGTGSAGAGTGAPK